MKGEERGTPGRYEPKHQPRLKLSDLVRRRKTTLKQMITDRGLTTYAALAHWCARIGVLPPTEKEFNDVMPPPVTSIQEGIVVLEAPAFTEEQTGRDIDPEAPIDEPGLVVLTDHPYEPPKPPTEDMVRPSKKLRREKKDQPPEQE